MTVTLRPYDKSLLNKLTVYETRNPTPDDDSVAGRVVKQLWVNQTSHQIFICTDATASAAVWLSIG